MHDWEPRSGPGGTYCSPSCGGMCKREWFDNATAIANRICKDLGEGWKPCVHENLGWFASATNGCSKISASYNAARGGELTFTARIEPNITIGSSRLQIITRPHLTPKRAMFEAKKEAEEVLKKLSAAIEEIKGAIE